jgi:uncharacterized repeat protein (TIGR03803 family)
MNNVQESTVRKTLTVATSRMPWRLVIRLIAGVVVMSIVVLSGEELKHVPPASPSFVVLHSFDGADGANPAGGPIRDAAGNLYGTTYSGGALGYGAVFKMSPSGTETVLYSFTAGPDGARPRGGLVRNAAGDLYGTTELGGSSTCPAESSCGVVFKLSPSGTETVLHTFAGADGANPLAGLIQDAAGNLYGTTVYGGAHGNGVVFELIRCSSLPSGYEFKVLHSFTGGADGYWPFAGLVRDAAGNLYGTTLYGGVHGEGVAFKVSPTGSETVLYSFTGGTDGSQPLAGLIGDAAVNLYGTTTIGGSAAGVCDNRGCGTVFKLGPTGTETVLYRFTGGADGLNPSAGLMRDAAGNLYGTTFGGSSACASGCGTVFKLDPTGTETVLHSFTGGADGAYPSEGLGLIQDAGGNLYGTTSNGGATSTCDPPNGCGVVFRLAP